MSARYAAVAGALLVLIAGCERGSRPAPDAQSAPAAPPTLGDEPAALSVRPAADYSKRAEGAAAAAPSRTPRPDLPQARDSATAGAMLIRTGNAMVQVDSLEVAVARVRQLAQQVGGYVANTSVQTGREQIRSATLELKLPSDRWQQAVSGLAPLGKVESVTEQTADVGEEYVDISARVANARRLEQRLVDLLARRTGKLEDVLAVERELARVREEIERYEGRLRYLRARVALSTLTVTVHEPRPVVGAYPGASVMGDAFRQSWRNFVGFLAALIASLGILIPLAVIAAAGWLVVRRVRGRRPATPRGDTANGAP